MARSNLSFRCAMAKRLALLILTALVAATAQAGSLRRQMNVVEKLRGARFTREVITVTLDRRDLPKHLRRQVEKTTPYSLEDYGTILKALYLVDPGVRNLIPTFFRLLQQQVLAYYDPLTNTYYAIRGVPPGMQIDSRTGVMRQAVAVHELTHALQDQRFGIGRTDLALRDDWDASLAFHAVIEGEASLVMLSFVAGMTGRSLGELVSNDLFLDSALAAAEKTVPQGTPRYLVDSLEFPYVAGLRFVAAAYKRGGWPAVDALYADPPRSTREVMHPDEYFAGRRYPTSLVRKAVHLEGGVLSVEHVGAFHWSFLVGADNAHGWIDDRVTIEQNALCMPTVTVETRWESDADAARFAAAYERFLRERSPEAIVVREGSAVRAAYGADDARIAEFAGQ
ncbi:MAG: hypothetical protein ACXW2F_12680 [Thermoanaerobaculia bacterium]